MKILGIDPGTTRIGFGAIESGTDLKLIDYGILNIAGGDKTLSLADSYIKLLKKIHPDLVVVEKLFFAKNKKTALAVAEARGVIILKTKETGTPLVEYTPLQVKIALTGYGSSDKKAVGFMVKKFLKMRDLDGHDDASDALAIAITAANRWKMDSMEA